MKLRTVALAGVAAAALGSSPAFANDTQGWYLGLGVGYDHQEPLQVTSAGLAGGARVGTTDTALVTGSFGYKWTEGLRIEFEASYDNHDLHAFAPGLVGSVDGTSEVKGALLNFLYDWDLGGPWSLSLGGGLGAGQVHESAVDSVFPAGRFIRGTQTGFMWQGIAGLNYEVDNNWELFADYRYRSAEIDHDYGSDFVLYNPVHIDRAEEHVALIGIRYYFYEPPAPPPPAPPPPPPPPPPAPAPVKTFIVFFDFDKSDLTEKAQEVVAEAVRTAKANGFVKVLVTGHTDTVGSDAYNQALSVRRAESVKDEMVREGLGADGIEIQGKSFHDPLVPTGPGVREPQNRRAVIDLGG